MLLKHAIKVSLVQEKNILLSSHEFFFSFLFFTSKKKYIEYINGLFSKDKLSFYQMRNW